MSSMCSLAGSEGRSLGPVPTAREEMTTVIATDKARNKAQELGGGRES
jgi:hypothetical protein